MDLKARSADRKQRRIDAARELERLEALRREMAAPAGRARALGITETAYAIWACCAGTPRTGWSRASWT